MLNQKSISHVNHNTQNIKKGKLKRHYNQLDEKKKMKMAKDTKLIF